MGVVVDCALKLNMESKIVKDQILLDGSVGLCMCVDVSF